MCATFNKAYILSPVWLYLCRMVAYAQANLRLTGFDLYEKAFYSCLHSLCGGEQ